MSVELSTFSHYGRPEESPHNWLAAVLGSSALYIIGGVVLVALSAITKQIIVEKKVELKFVETVIKEEPPPAPPPKPVEIQKPKPAPAAAPVIPKDMKVRKLDQPPPAKELVAPKDMPKEAPKEADPSQDKGIAVYGEPGKGDPAGLEGGSADGVAGGQVGAIALPEDADPPMPLKTNEPPKYPELARDTGKTGTVILKVVILADGRVSDVQIMRGEEPFASAAVEAVKKWKYTPAHYKGQPITVYRMIQIPFKLTV